MYYPKKVRLLRIVRTRKQVPERRRTKKDRIGTQTGWMCDDVDGDVGCFYVCQDSRYGDQIWTRMGWWSWMWKAKIVKTQMQTGKRNEAEDDGWN